MTSSASQRSTSVYLVAILVIVATTLWWGPDASAHTAFESSRPANGDIIDAPVDQITVVFTTPASPAGDGFLVLTPAGRIIEPTVDVGDDGRSFVLTLDEPLVDGDVGVRWRVRAGDAHPIEGAFSFTTTAPPPTPTPLPTPLPTPTATLATPTAVVGASPGEPRSAPTPDTPTPDRDTATSDAQRRDITSSSDDAASVTVPLSTAEGTDATEDPDDARTDLATFLDVESPSTRRVSDTVSLVARAISIVATLVTLGLTAFGLMLTVELLDRARHRQLAAVAAVVLAVAAAGEGGSFLLGNNGEALSGQQGLAVALRFAGALVLAGGALGRRRMVQLIGATSVLASFAFDGHTVTEGNRVVTSLVDVVHVAGGAVWLGGIIVLVWMSRSNDQDLAADLPLFAGRFSVIAPVALAGVGLAGLGLAVTILDSLSELWTTDWGRLLIAKTALVAGAAALGAYNHFRLVPALDDAVTAATRTRFARIVGIEFALLVVVGVVTGALVAAAS